MSLIAAAIVAFVSCRQIVDLPANQTVAACGLPFGTTDCAACAAANCCAQANACASDRVVCRPYESCLGACDGDPACRANCTIDYGGSGSAGVSALSACLASSCASACGLTCGGLANYITEPSAASSCDTCLTKVGCERPLACATSAECDAFVRCLAGCPDSWCNSACVADHDAGAALFRPFYNYDFSNTCAGSCGYGSNWGCAGLARSGGALPSSVAVTEYVYEYPTGTGTGGSPIVGARVSACPATQCPCSGSDVPTGQTDDAGFVTLELPAQATEETYCLQASAPGYLTTLAFGGGPYMEPVVSVVDSLLQPQTLGIALIPSSYSNPTGVNVGVKVIDCLADPAHDVDVSLSVVPSSAATGDAARQDAGVWQAHATANGSPVFGPAPPGIATLTATAAGVVVSQATAIVATGMITEVLMVPTPTP